MAIIRDGRLCVIFEQDICMSPVKFEDEREETRDEKRILAGINFSEVEKGDIGRYIPDEDVQLPRLSLVFENPDSIDVLIKKLREVKSYLNAQKDGVEILTGD